MKRTVHHIQLPSDFAQKLLDNQIQYKLALQPSKQTISNLIQLYTYGVEYYQSIRSYKYLYFQKKMNQLFNTGSALQIMNKPQTNNNKLNQKSGQGNNENQSNPSPNKNDNLLKQYKQEQYQSPINRKLKSQKSQDKIEAYKIKQKQQKMFNQILQKTNYTITSNETKHIIRDVQYKQQIVQKVINKELQSQKRTLQEKLKLRKARSIMAKSMSSIQLFDNQDKGTRDSLFDFGGSIIMTGNDSINSSDQKNNKTQILSNNKAIIKEPIKVNFQSLINQNQESQDSDQQDNRKRKKSGFSKRIMSTHDLNNMEDQI